MPIIAIGVSLEFELALLEAGVGSRPGPPFQLRQAEIGDSRSFEFGCMGRTGSARAVVVDRSLDARFPNA